MLSAKTVFILGAGASKEINLPTGDELMGDIIKYLDINESINSNKCRFVTRNKDLSISIMNFDRANYKNYIDAAVCLTSNLYLAPSIDNFVHTHNDNEFIRWCSKISIASCILKREESSEFCGKVFFEDQEVVVERNIGEGAKESWYRILFHMMSVGVDKSRIEEFGKNCSFIVFNYDRCLEHFLFNSVLSYYNIDPLEAAAIVRKIPIFHPYGVIAPLQWQNPLGLSYGNTKANIVQIINNIRTFTETESDASKSGPIRHAYTQAERKVFLGFGFHKINMSLLGGAGISRSYEVYATAKGFSDENVNEIDMRIKTSMIGASVSRIEIKNKDTCKDLLWRFSEVLTS